MCNAVSLIVRKDGEMFFPAPDTWDHSHTGIAKHHGLPDGLLGDSLARVEVTPEPEPDGAIRWHKGDGCALRTDVDDWKFTLDERRAPSWWVEDAVSWEDRARRAVKRWLETKAPRHLVPGYVATGGDYSTLTGGDYSNLTGGDYSNLTGGDYSNLTGGARSTLTGGARSTLTGGAFSTLTGGACSNLTGGAHSTLTGGVHSNLTGGDCSTLTGGDYSNLTGGDYSTLTGGAFSTLTGGDCSNLTFDWWDGKRTRRTTIYVGEDGIEPNVAYRCVGRRVERVAKEGE